MANSIVKHRRGTTAEWQRIDLVPESGELVIEELPNGTRKCKIGDGTTKFSKLPYLADDIREQLLGKLSQLEAVLTKADQDAEARVQSKTAELEQLVQQIANKIASETTDRKAQIQDAVNGLQADVDAKIDAVKGLVESSDAVSSSTLEEKVEELSADIADAKLAAIAAAKQHTDNAVKSTKDTVQAELGTQLTALNNTVAELSDTVEAEIIAAKVAHAGLAETVDTAVTSAVSKAKQELNTALTTLEKKHDTETAKLEDSIGSCSLAMDQKLAAQTETTKRLIAEAKQTIDEERDNAITSSLNTALQPVSSRIGLVEQAAASNKQQAEAMSNDLADQQTVLTALQTVISDLVTARNDLNTALSTLGDTHTADISSIRAGITELANRALELETTVVKLADDHTGIRNSLQTSIDTVQSNLSNFISSATDELNLIEAAVKTETDARTQQHDALATKHETDHAAVLERIAKIERNEILFSDSLSGLSTKLTSEIRRIASDYNTKFANQAADIADLRYTVSTNKTELTNRTDELSKTVSRSLSALTNDLAELDNRVTMTAGSFENLERQIDVQAARISNIASLPHGSTTGDAELMDIRTDYHGITHPSAVLAVHQIGKDLDELKRTLPEFIPSSAVDGLHYEDNLLYLTSGGEYLDEFGEPIFQPALVVGGGGGSGSTSIVQLTNLGSHSSTISKGTQAVIEFTYNSIENGVDSNYSGLYDIIINDVAIPELSGEVVPHGEIRRDISKYLVTGSNTIKLVCRDTNDAVKTATVKINVIELRIDSAFDASTIRDSAFTFSYTVTGQIDKTVHVFLDGRELTPVFLSAAVSGRENQCPIAKQSHGKHTITAFVTATLDSGDVTSNTLQFDFLAKEPGQYEALLASVYPVKEVTEGDLVSIPFLLYDPQSPECTVLQEIYTEDDYGTRTLYSTKPVQTAGAQQDWTTRQYPAGKKVVFVIKYNYVLFDVPTEIKVEHYLKVNPLEVNLEADTNALQLFLTAAGRQNSEANKDSWTFTPAASEADPNPTTITTEFKNFNWVSNGWINDKPDNTGDTCLRISGDARAIINFKPFDTDFKNTGKTIEFEFAVRDVHKRKTVVIECNKAYDADGKVIVNNSYGFVATPDKATFSSNNSQVSCSYKDEERIRIAVTVENSSTDSRFISIYLDGVLSGIQRYENDTFLQDNAVPILLGSNDCCLDLYAIRVYSKALPHRTILDNFIADKADPKEKQELVKANDITHPSSFAILYKEVKELGQIPIITLTGTLPKFKGDKKKEENGDIVKMKFEDPFNPKLNFEHVLKEIDVQGTSSQFYVRKNWKIKFKDNITHMPGAIPAKTYCIKVDYAEATGTHNTGCANYVETLYDRNKAQIPPQADDTRIRTTIQGFPCVIFEKPDDQSEPVFASKCNFNYDKGAENAFGFTKDYDSYGVECWEFCNNTSAACNLVGPIKAEWSSDFEPRYVPKSANFDRIEELLEIKALAEKDPPEGTMTTQERTELANLQAACIKNFKEMHDWVLSTATYTLVNGVKVAITPKPLDKSVTYAGTEYTIDDKDYRLAKFKAEFKKYFNMHYSSIYYVFTFFALMTDQRAKNMFLTRWAKPVAKNSSTGTWWIGEEDSLLDSEGPAPAKQRDETGREFYVIAGEQTPAHYWYPYFYDNDTIFGINNEGALVFDYFHEDTDQLKSEAVDGDSVTTTSANVYNGQNSVLWTNFRECFPADIANTYKSLRKSGSEKISYDKIIDCFVTKGSDKWCAAIYNEDAEYKYVSMARYEHAHTDANGKEVFGVDTSNLYQVRGTGEQHLRYFIANRIKYCDSKWYAGDYPNDIIFLRVYTPAPIPDEAIDAMTDPAEKQAALESNAIIKASLEAVKADPSITVTPFSDMYTGVKYKANGILQQQRSKAGYSYKFSPPGENEEKPPVDDDTTSDSDFGAGLEGADSDETYGDTETAIYGASEISSLGNLAGLYCGVINVSNATKLTELILGSPDPRYRNDNFREVHVGTNRLLKKIDVRNCAGLGVAGKNPQTILALNNCPNIEEIYADGTNLSAINLPDSGYVKKLHLPQSINSLTIKNQPYLTEAGFKIANDNYSKITTLCIEGCPGLDTNEILRKCSTDIDAGKFTVSRVRLSGLNWELDSTDFLKALFPTFDEHGNLVSGIRGIDKDGYAVPDAYLKGNCYIKSTASTDAEGKTVYSAVSGDDYAEIKLHYPDLNITFDKMNSKITFKCPKIIKVGSTFKHDGYDEVNYTIESSNSVLPTYTSTATQPVPTPTWPENDGFTYELVGWSRYEQPYVGVLDDEKRFEQYLQADALKAIAGARTVYPVFKAIRKTYTVRFVNIADEGEYLLTQLDSVPYNYPAVYPKDELGDPQKLTSVDPSMYRFVTWDPDPSHILKDTICRPVFAFIDGKWVTLPITDIGEYQDYNDITRPGYILNATKQTMEIANCKNKLIKAIIVPDSYEIDGVTYSVNRLGGFSSSHHLERLDLPDTITTLTTSAFTGCYRLLDFDLPSNLTTIGSYAFQGCNRLEKIVLPASVASIGSAAFAECARLKEIDVSNNSNFIFEDGCLIQASDRTLLQGGIGKCVIPAADQFSKLGDYCFASTPIETVALPSHITTIPTNAFSSCKSLKNVILHEGITQLDATCFAWCPQLTSIELPSTLKWLYTFVFDGCGLTSVTIPGSVRSMRQRSFGYLKNLTEVRIEASPDGWKPTNPEKDFALDAFEGSGAASGVHFYLPWTASEAAKIGAPWGAKNAILHCTDTE